MTITDDDLHILGTRLWKAIHSDRAAVAFPLGRLCITPGAMEELAPDEVQQSLCRHARGDWGDVCEEDRQENELSLREGFRLLSAYHTDDAVKLWIITEADRSVTTVLLPSEY
jgi:hypothetical protein